MVGITSRLLINYYIMQKAVLISFLAAAFLLAGAGSAQASNMVYYGHAYETLATTLYPIYQVGLKGAGNQALFIAGKELYSPEGLAVSPNGKKLAWAEPAGVFGLVLMGSDGKNKHYLEDAGLGIDHMVSWHPDGSGIIFVRENFEVDGTVGHIYMANKNGKNVTLLLVPSGNLKSQYNPSYSPNGKKVVFEGVNQKGKHNIYTIKPDSTGLKKLTKCKYGCFEPRYSPNGKRIAYVKKYKKRYQLWTMKKGGAGKKRLTRKGEARTPSYAPKGKKVFFAFKKKGEGDFDIHSLRLKDKQKKRLTDNDVDDLRPTVGEIK